MLLRDLTCCFAGYSRRNPDSTVVHLLVGIAGGRGTHTFCGLRVTAVTSSTYLGDVCPGCVSRAKHMGCGQ